MTSRKGHLRKLSRSFESKMEIENETSSMSKSKENNKNNANKNRNSLDKNETEHDNAEYEDFLVKNSKRKNKQLLLDEDGNFPLSLGNGRKEEETKQNNDHLSPPSIKESLESKDTATSEMVFDDLFSRYREEREEYKRLINNEDKKEKEGRMEIETKVTQVKKTEVVPQNQNDCSICLSQMSDIIAKLNSCTHTFCFDCIKDWSKVANECPLCKHRFSKITKWSKDGTKLGEARIKFKAQVSEEPEYEIIENTDEACYECGSADDMVKMLVCEECMFYCCHIYCCRPPMTRIPIDPWYCLFCRPDQRVIRQREREESHRKNNNNSGPRRMDSVVSRSIRNSLPEDSVLARLFETADREIQKRESGNSSGRKREEKKTERGKREVSKSSRKRRDSSESEEEKEERRPRKKSTSRRTSTIRKKKNTDERSRSRTKSKNKTIRQKKTVKSSRSPKKTSNLKPTSSRKKKTVVKTAKK